MRNQEQRPTAPTVGEQCADTAALLAKTIGPHDLFIDWDWECSEVGRDIDLFDRFSEHARESIALRELLLIFRGRPHVIYAVPQTKTEAFLNFLEIVLVPMPDGSFISPVYSRPSPPPPHVTDPAHDLAELWAHCHVIGHHVWPADHPDVLIARMRNRNALAAGPNAPKGSALTPGG